MKKVINEGISKASNTASIRVSELSAAVEVGLSNIRTGISAIFGKSNKLESKGMIGDRIAEVEKGILVLSDNYKQVNSALVESLVKAGWEEYTEKDYIYSDTPKNFIHRDGKALDLNNGEIFDVKKVNLNFLSEEDLRDKSISESENIVRMQDLFDFPFNEVIYTRSSREEITITIANDGCGVCKLIVCECNTHLYGRHNFVVPLK